MRVAGQRKRTQLSADPRRISGGPPGRDGRQRALWPPLRAHCQVVPVGRAGAAACRHDDPKVGEAAAFSSAEKPDRMCEQVWFVG